MGEWGWARVRSGEPGHIGQGGVWEWAGLTGGQVGCGPIGGEGGSFPPFLVFFKKTFLFYLFLEHLAIL